MPTRALLLAPLLLTTGCVSAVSSVVTAPFKVAGKAVDVMTTSQSEADRNRGRKIRQFEERARQDCRREVANYYEVEQCVRGRLRESGLI